MTTYMNGQSNGSAGGLGDARSAYGLDYKYSNGDSENDFIKKNAFSKESGYGITNFANPVLGLVSAFRGKAAYKKARALYEAQMAEQAKQQRAQDYYGKMATLDQSQREVDQVRQGALNAVDDPAMIANDNAEVEAGYQGDIGNRYAGLAEDFGRSSQKQGLAAARRGIMGGSNDAEQQADLSAGFQSNLMDASQAALGRSANDYRARADSRSNLRKSILTGDQAQAAGFTAQSRGEEAQNERESRMMDYMNAFTGLRNEQAANNSRLIGGAASAIGDSYTLDQNAKADGGRGLY
jgi:hypothetical protein